MGPSVNMHILYYIRKRRPPVIQSIDARFTAGKEHYVLDLRHPPTDLRLGRCDPTSGQPMRSTFLFHVVTALLAVPLTEPPAVAQTPSESTVVYLVRHAEKVDNSTDPPLSQDGRQRANLLAEMLRDAGVTHLHTTDFERTRATLDPLAEHLGLAPRIYSGGDLVSFADWLKITPGRHLVSGHSNTTPQLVRLLGGESSYIADHEYDRFYVVTLYPDRATTTVLIRFGATSGS